MKILSEKEHENGYTTLDIAMSDKEEEIAYKVGKYLLPNETDKEKLIHEAVVYFFVVLIIEDYNEEDD